MSSKRGKQKETVEEDFEAFVRHQLSSISDDLKEMKGTQVKIQRDIEYLQSQIKKNESSISKLKESLDTKLEVLTGQLHEANTRIDQIEDDITKYAKESMTPTRDCCPWRDIPGTTILQYPRINRQSSVIS